MNHTITGADWKRSIAASRRTPNLFVQRIRAGLALAGVLAAAPGSSAMNQSEPLDISRMVAVLRSLENGPESNPWQFTGRTWATVSKVPMRDAGPAEHRRAAWLHVQACVRSAQFLDLPLSAKWVGVIWHAGVGTVQSSRLTAAQRDFGDRAANLYADPSFMP